MHAEYKNGSWAFVDPLHPSHRIKFDQALIDATHTNRARGRVEGFVCSVHGVEQDVAQFLDSETKAQIGITSSHKLGRFGSMNRVRLMPDGSIERVVRDIRGVGQ